MTVNIDILPGPEFRATEQQLALAGDAKRWRQALLSAYRALSREVAEVDTLPGFDTVRGAGASTGVLLDHLRKAQEATIWIHSVTGMFAGLNRLPSVPRLRVLVDARAADLDRMPWLRTVDTRLTTASPSEGPEGPDAVVLDGATVAVIPRPAEPEPYALILRQNGLAELVQAMFDLAWPGAPALLQEPTCRTADAELKRQIMCQLADGGKDEAISRALGISLRTCRRYIAEILTDVGAVSRFQAGYRLGRDRLAGAR
ncbi:hypothetical protein MRQ36_01720 [Micromonospora sp. R77]|uniref:hypothetical protein n=1 Tax=Micromonospora sp. R77 TaxID=2925836 RepID=UPI001F60A8C9|nr:hypothetical protein [Micromonospora sp. R77]MCI4061358.1 hypothetical protein [Micromonospora sp. R77]